MQLGRYGVAIVAALALALMGAAATLKVLADRAGPQVQASGAAGMPLQVVLTAPVTPKPFADEVQALGTAQAYESIVVASKVADTIRSIRFESGQRVAKGQVLVELASVEQQADLAEARAQLEADRSDLERIQDLAARGFATRANLDLAEAAARRSEARVDALSARIADRTIRAPFAGVLGLRNASVGQFLQPGEAIVTLDDVSRIKLDFEAPETQLALVQPGVALVAETGAYPGRTFSGEINQIDSRIDPATRSIRARAVLPNKDGALKPGMLLTVRVQANPRRGLAVPETALVERGDGAFVYRVVPGGAEEPAKVELARIELGRRGGGFIEVASGLNQGDQVVAEGVNRVRPGQAVEPKPLAADLAAGGAPTERAN